MAITLYGPLISNYYSIVKAAMLEKGMAFEEVDVAPGQGGDYRDKSPMGKVPAMGTEHGFLSETAVMLDYIDAVGPGPSLYPADPFARAKVRELMRVTELYIELPGRRLYGDVFFNRPADEREKAAVRPLLEKGFGALMRLAAFDPHIAGGELSCADFYFLFAISPVTLVCRRIWDWDVRREIPEIGAHVELMGRRESVRKVQADQRRGS